MGEKNSPELEELLRAGRDKLVEGYTPKKKKQPKPVEITEESLEAGRQKLLEGHPSKAEEDEEAEQEK